MAMIDVQGSTRFPGLVAYIGNACTHRFARHVHGDAYSVGYVLVGRSAFGCGRVRHTLAARQLCVFPPGMAHDGGPAHADPWDFVTIHVPAAVAGVALAPTGVSDGGVVRDDATAVRLAKELVQAMRRGDAEAEAALARALLVRLYPDLARSAPPHASTPAAPGRSVGQLAMQAGLHRCTFSRRFHVARGIAPSAYLLSCRAERAQHLVLAGVPLAEAASEAGFADQSHMTRAMRAVFGVTPGTLRSLALSS